MTIAKIGVNKLGEYMTANPARRRQIVKIQKQDKTFIFGRYNDARSSIVTYISGGMTDDKTLLENAEILRNFTDESEFKQSDKHASSEAIEDFFEASEEISLEKLDALPGSQFESHSINIGGIAVTTKPDIILKNKETGEVEGCIKLHFSKTAPLSSDAGQYVATIMKTYLEQGLCKGKNVDPKKCYVIDTPTASVFVAPKAYKKRMNEIEAACEEIKARWDTSSS